MFTHDLYAMACQIQARHQGILAIFCEVPRFRYSHKSVESRVGESMRDRTELETQSMILVDRRYKTGGIDLRVSFAPRHASHGTCNSTFVDMENTSLGDSIQVGQKCFPLPRSNQCQWTDRS